MEEYEIALPNDEVDHNGGFPEEPDTPSKRAWKLIEAERRDPSAPRAYAFKHKDRVAICQTLFYLYGFDKALKVAAEICNPDPEWHADDLKRYENNLRAFARRKCKTWHTRGYKLLNWLGFKLKTIKRDD